MQRPVSQGQGSPWTQESNRCCVQYVPDRYLESHLQAGALFCKRLSEDKLTEHSVVISKAEETLVRKRGYIFKDEMADESG